MCDQCDQIQLTIRLPQPLEIEPAQLMAFLYSADTWTFPPTRPPDGGTSDCQIKDPQISYGTPYTLTVPACTYYREQCLSGQYMLYVALMQTDTIPPIMRDGDYWWGMPQQPIPPGGGPPQLIELDITLEPYSD